MNNRFKDRSALDVRCCKKHIEYGMLQEAQWLWCVARSALNVVYAKSTLDMV